MAFSLEDLKMKHNNSWVQVENIKTQDVDWFYIEEIFSSGNKVIFTLFNPKIGRIKTNLSSEYELRFVWPECGFLNLEDYAVFFERYPRRASKRTLYAENYKAYCIDPTKTSWDLSPNGGVRFNREEPNNLYFILKGISSFKSTPLTHSLMSYLKKSSFALTKQFALVKRWDTLKYILLYNLIPCAIVDKETIEIKEPLLKQEVVDLLNLCPDHGLIVK